MDVTAHPAVGEGSPGLTQAVKMPVNEGRAAGEPSVLQIASGAIRGTVENGLHVFRGIPYAEPPVGRARWLAPAPRKPWVGVLDATQYGATCHQYNARVPGRFPSGRRKYLEAIHCGLPEGDDCLLLNVWSPSLVEGASLPVMVYIHGGGFTQGAAFEIYDGSAFARRGTVVVVIQYRLGPPGFLHGSGLFNDGFCTDNRGFLDQVAALRWVRDNIARFGGDPGNVTIFGESAGAFSVFPLTASPLAAGLFRRAIAMGGSPDGHAPAAEYHELTRDALADIGIRPGDEAALAALDTAALERLQKSVGDRIFAKHPEPRYGSIGRMKVNGQGAATGSAFLPVPPLRGGGTVTPNDIDMMLGTCAGDGRLFSLILPLPKELTARLFASRLSGLFPNGDLDALRNYYRRCLPRPSGMGLHEQINNDAIFRMPTIAAAEDHASGHPGRTYLYEVNYVSAIPGLGAIHGIEVALLFNSAQARALIFQDEATAALSEMMLEAWTSFAKTGKPSAPGMPQWQPYETRSRNTMVFDRVTRLEAGWGEALRRYWSNPQGAARASGA